MLSLADTAELFDQTTTLLIGDPAVLASRARSNLIEQWVAALQAGENTRPLTDQLITLKTLLAATPVDEPAVRGAISPLTESLTLLSTRLGGEGEIPANLGGVAARLQQVAGLNKIDVAG